jgi:hypothetical protein
VALIKTVLGFHENRIYQNGGKSQGLFFAGFNYLHDVGENIVPSYAVMTDIKMATLPIGSAKANHVICIILFVRSNMLRVNVMHFYCPVGCPAIRASRDYYAPLARSPDVARPARPRQHHRREY